MKVSENFFKESGIDNIQTWPPKFYSKRKTCVPDCGETEEMATILEYFKQSKPSNIENNNKIIDTVKKEEAIIERKPSDHELKILSQFDIENKYGPCIGITRLERWERAYKYGLNPPSDVYTILKMNENNNFFQENIWSSYQL